MRPPMKQLVTAHIPLFDDLGKPINDKYGRPQTETIISKAGVQFKSQIVLDTTGAERQANVEIDIPPNFNPPTGAKIDYLTIAGEKGSGTILSKDETTNLARNKVYFRTVYADG